MSSLFHSLSCSISSQSLQYSLLEAAMSCCTAPSSGNIWPWTEYHRLLSGRCGWVIFKFNLPDSPSHTAHVDLYFQLAQLFWYLFTVLCLSTFRRKSDQEGYSSEHFKGTVGCILSPVYKVHPNYKQPSHLSHLKCLVPQEVSASTPVQLKSMAFRLLYP